MSPGYRKNNPTKKTDPQRFGVIFLVRTRSIWRGTIGGPICDDLVYGFFDHQLITMRFFSGSTRR